MSRPMPEKRKEAFSGWIIYDADCGICTAWISRCKNIFLRRNFDMVPLQAEWIRRELDLDYPDMLRDFRIRLAGGDLLEGADAYRWLLRKIWWAYPFYLLSRVPPCKQIFDTCYRYIADHRQKISHACSLSDGPGMTPHRPI